MRTRVFYVSKLGNLHSLEAVYGSYKSFYIFEICDVHMLRNLYFVSELYFHPSAHGIPRMKLNP